MVCTVLCCHGVWHSLAGLLTTMFVLQLQAWLHRPEEEAVMARGLLKSLVIRTPEKAIFAFAGSSMATTAPNGISMLVPNAQCHLPAAVSAAASAESWHFLQKSRPKVPDGFKHYISHSYPAVQVYLARVLLNQIRRPSTEAELLAFVQEFGFYGLQPAVRACSCPVVS